MDPDRLVTMAKLFGVALVLVGPYGFVRIRRTLRETAARRADPELRPEPAGGEPTAGEPTAGEDAAELIASLERHRDDGEGPLTLVVRPDAAVNGRPAPPGVVTALLDDAARRSGMTITWSTDGVNDVATVIRTDRSSSG